MDELLGQRLGDYRLLLRVSQRSFVQIYLGVHVRSGMPASIKLLPARVSADALRLFCQEARRLVKLSHPHLVHVLEFGVVDGRAFLVMEAPAEALRQHYPAGMRIPVSQATEYIAQVGSALQYAHEWGLFHGDLRPEHLSIRPESGKLILDNLGIVALARALAVGPGWEDAATNPYSAFAFSGEEPGPADDQYALAAIAYEWLTGELPYAQPTSAAYSSVYLQETLARKVPAIHPDAGAALAIALGKTPARRFAHIGMFTRALASC